MTPPERLWPDPTFFVKLEAARVAKGLSRKEVCERAGLAPSRWTMMVRHHEARWSTIAKLASVLKVPIPRLKWSGTPADELAVLASELVALEAVEDLEKLLQAARRFVAAARSRAELG